MKKIIALSFLFLMMVVISCAPAICNKPYLLVGNTCCLDQNDNSICDNDETTSSQEKKQGEQQPLPEIVKTEEIKAVPQPILKKMNEAVTVDYLTYKVTKVETFTEMGTSFFNKKTEGKFVKVYVNILNNAKESQNIFSPRFTLEDNQGRRFDEFPGASLYITDSLDFGQQVQPGLSISGAVVFELPKDAQDLKLVIKGDWLSETEVIVQLSNIQNIGKDTTQKEEQDKIWDQNMEEAEEKTQELLNKCNAPFKCTSSCSEYADVGQKDCSSGEVCCLE